MTKDNMVNTDFLRAAAFLVPVACQSLLAQDGNGTYLSNDGLMSVVEEIAGSSSQANLSQIGTSLQGEPIHLITLSSGDEAIRPGFLIVAGIDGRYLAGTEEAVRISRGLLKDHAALLEHMNIYIIPRANPDGAAANLQSHTMGRIGNARDIDEDRDRAINEDGFDDLNGDGVITMMRRLEPTLDDAPTHLADPNFPQLNIEPDSEEDQRAAFTLYSEGLDTDGDGAYNEDGSEGVDLDQNFMHLWPEHEPHAGRYPLSEPESEAIARFVLEHHNIVMALTLGRHDNLVNIPDVKSKDITGRAPKGIDAEDEDLYKLAGEMYEEATGVESAPKEEIAGSFHAWLYAQRGIASFAAVPWTRPALEESSDVETSDDKESEEADQDSGLTPSGVGDISQETLDELAALYEQQTGESVDESMISRVTPEMIEGFAAQAGIEIKRIPAVEESDSETEDTGEKKPKKKKKSDDAKWLEYFEQEGIDGFVDWEPFEHPTLGPVEIGGFNPLARINPPASQLDGLSDDLTSFVVDLIDARPEISVSGPEVKELGNGVYEIRISIMNDGEFPTTTGFSRSKRTVLPSVIRLSTELDQIITGQRVSRVWGIDGQGGRSDHRWIIRSKDISKETIEIQDPRFGNHTIRVGN
jgi:hypothetical protein